MSCVCGKLDIKDADFEICWKHTSHAQESDGDETDQITNEESTLGSLHPKYPEKDENLTTKPVVVIPAIKGSREKHGLSLRKSSVSWAADVYDPPPSVASHTRSKKQQQKSKSKDKTRKKGQKSKEKASSRGGSSKDKKQASGKFEWATQVPIVASS